MDMEKHIIGIQNALFQMKDGEERNLPIEGRERLVDSIKWLIDMRWPWDQGMNVEFNSTYTKIRKHISIKPKNKSDENKQISTVESSGTHQDSRSISRTNYRSGVPRQAKGNVYHNQRKAGSRH